VFVPLSKLLDVLLDPVAWALLLGAAALALRRRPRAAASAGILAIAVLWAMSTPLVAGALARAAERGAPETFRPAVTYDAVVVLGGAMDPAASEATGGLELNASADRLVRGYELLRAGRARFALISGGAVDERSTSPREAALAVRALAAWGIAPDRLVAEDRSRNTRENVLECARIVRERGWRRLLVVTSAAHMPRALGCFRAAGLEPDALPVDRRAPLAGFAARLILPRAWALQASADVLRELGGRVVYRAMGYTR
jgi:uncharacterized SAM-binding protein YcdF (DUF218 family)